MKTMSHTPEQRKLWHAGKREPNETKETWFDRVIRRKNNFSGAFSPVQLKNGMWYADEAIRHGKPRAVYTVVPFAR